MTELSFECFWLSWRRTVPDHRIVEGGKPPFYIQISYIREVPRAVLLEIVTTICSDMSRAIVCSVGYQESLFSRSSDCISSVIWKMNNSPQGREKKLHPDGSQTQNLYNFKPKLAPIARRCTNLTRINLAASTWRSAGCPDLVGNFRVQFLFLFSK